MQGLKNNNTQPGNYVKQWSSQLLLWRLIRRAIFWHPHSLSTRKSIYSDMENYNLVTEADLVTKFLSNNQTESTKRTYKGHWTVFPRAGQRWCKSRQHHLTLFISKASRAKTILTFWIDLSQLFSTIPVGFDSVEIQSEPAGWFLFSEEYFIFL